MGQNTDKNTLEQKPLLESAGSGLVSIFKKKDKVSHGPKVAVGDDFTTRGAPTRRTPVPHPPNSKSCPACPPPPCPPPPCPPPDFKAHQPDTVLVSGDHIKVVNATTCGPTTYVVNSVPYDVKVDKDTMTGDGVNKPIAVNVFTGKLPGLVPKANNDQKGMFLRSDGKWVANNFDVQAEDESITVRVTTDAGNTTFWLKAKRDIDSIFYGDETTTYAEWLEAANVSWATSWGGTDDYGFGILPAGFYYGSFINVRSYAYFWTSTEYSSSNAYRRTFATDSSMSSDSDDKYYGNSVRLVKDS